MMSRWISTCLFVLVASLASSLAAALPDLPGEAMGDDVAGVLWVDAAKVDAGRLSSAIDAAMGQFARPVNDAMAPYAKLHAPFIRAGGTSMAIVYFDPFSANAATKGVANPVFLFSMSANANRAAIESIVEQATLNEKGKSTVKFEKMGDWLMAYDGTLARPYMEKGKADRMESLRSALEGIDQHAATLAFVPTRRMQVTYQQRVGIDTKTPRDLLLFIRTLLECRSLSISATLEGQPSLSAVMRMPDGETAAQLLEIAKPLLDTLGQFMKRKDMRGVDIEQITQLTSWHAVLANNSLEISRSQVTAQAAGPVLTRTGEALAKGIRLARDEALVVRSLNQMQALITALNSYAEDHRGQYPTRLEDLGASSYVRELDKLMINPLTGQSPGYVYVKPTLTLNQLLKERRAARTPILYEAKDGRLNPRGLIGYVNVHVERPDLGE